MADFSCIQDIPEQSGLKTDDLTVGRTFLLHCRGPWPSGADPLKFKPELVKTEPYRLKFLNAAVTKEGVDFEVTSYMAGPANYPNLVISDGEKKIELGAVQFQVRSMLDPKKNPPQEPYGAFGPFAMGVPTSWWVGLAIIAAAILGFVGFRVRKTIQRREVLKKLAEHDTAMTPSAEFHMKLRRLQREGDVYAGRESTHAENKRITGEIEKAFRTFFMRRFRVPALQWSDRAVMSEFKRTNRTMFDDRGAEIYKLLREFELARNSIAVEAKDVLQLTETARRLAETMDRELNIQNAQRRKN